jgi:hypothetical protein
MPSGAPRTSLIGVRAVWTCCICHAKATTYQLVDAADPTIDLPNGWRQLKGRTYCPDATAVQAIDLIFKERTQ